MVVAAVIAMTHRLKRIAVAEGIETKGQLSFLRTENCDCGQGFLFSHPLPPAVIDRTFREIRKGTRPFQQLFEA
jgi:EAL domain-containing protein (putative c-di-GMP-specific phosphodiesterase class I)